MQYRKRASILWGVLLMTVGTLPALATEPPAPGARFPRAYFDRIRKNPRAFTYQRALRPMAERVRRNRMIMAAPGVPESAAPTAVSGTRRIPVLPFQFSDTTGEPFAVANLQKELFDGPWPTGTMTEYYREISYGRFTVNGTVMPWKKISHPGTFYAGNCNGLCGTAKVPAMLKEALDANGSLDWAQFDNDGPDGVPNSGDDDGYVDFVAFVQPQIGGECGQNPNIWSHRSNLADWGATEYTTKSAKSGGGFIKINDYVIMPSLACNGTTMIQIGVFCHEFGHAFGLPDLYDTDTDNGESEGVGNWCLMAAGSWGGDGKTPERPAHMSAWSKTFLGWIRPTLVTGDISPASLKRAEDTAVAFKIPILGNGGMPTKQYYLVENRERVKFDEKLFGGGILVWKINDAVVEPGLQNNTVNADVNNKGVALIEADDLKEMDKNLNRGDAGDPFPGDKNKRAFDNTTAPKSIGAIALCSIGDAGETMTLRVSLSGKCQGPQTTTPAAPKASGTSGQTTPPSGEEPIAVTLSELADHPERYANKTVTVSGKLENEGKNYFTDRRLVLKTVDTADTPKSVSVRSLPVPAETPSPPPESTVRQPRTISTYVGKEVKVTAVVEKNDNGQYVLAIKSLAPRK